MSPLILRINGLMNVQGKFSGSVIVVMTVASRSKFLVHLWKVHLVLDVNGGLSLPIGRNVHDERQLEQSETQCECDDLTTRVVVLDGAGNRDLRVICLHDIKSVSYLSTVFLFSISV